MRVFFLIAGVVLAAFVIQQEILYRTATTEALIGAYRSAALDKCSTRADQLTASNPGIAWATPRSIKLVIGDPDVDVYFWQVSNPLWVARYQDPHLVIVAERAPHIVHCEFDIRANVAVVKGIG